MHHVENFMALHRDGQVFCNYCSTYLGIWDEAFSGMVSRSEELAAGMRRLPNRTSKSKTATKRRVPVVQAVQILQEDILA